MTCQTCKVMKKIPNKGINYKFIRNNEKQVLNEYKYKSNKKVYPISNGQFNR